MFGVVGDYYNSKLRGKQYKQNTTPKSYKTEIKIIANHELAYSVFEQPGPGCLAAHTIGYCNNEIIGYCNMKAWTNVPVVALDKYLLMRRMLHRW